MTTEARQHYDLACEHDRNGREAAAYPHYEKALALGLPTELRLHALVGLGSTLRNLGLRQRSLDTLQRALAEFPTCHDVGAFIALTELSFGRDRATVRRLLAEMDAGGQIQFYGRAIRYYAHALGADNDCLVLVPAAESAALAESLFAVQCDHLRRVLTDAHVTADIEHVGSTAVPGLEGKGDLDIQVTTSDEDHDTACEAVSAHYLTNPGGFAPPDGRSYKLDESVPPLGVHVVRRGGAADKQRHIRDALLASPALVQRLNELKRRYEGESQDTYREAKADFFEAMLA